MEIVGFDNLPPLMLSGNFPDAIVVSGSSKNISVYKNNVHLFDETYQHSGDFLIYFRFKELFDSLLSTMIPLTDDILEQNTSVAEFTIEVEEAGGKLPYIFTLVKGGVDSDVIDSENFLVHNFLTWKPQVKKVKYLDPQWLTYYAVAESHLKVQATWQADEELVTSDVTEQYNLTVGRKSTMNVKFERLWEQFAQEGRQPYYIDCWIENASGEKLTYTQRYVLTDEYHEFDDLFIFENSPGGVDVIRFTGELSREIKHEFRNALFGEVTREFDITLNQPVQKNTGYFRNAYELLWTNDFLASLNRYHFVNGIPLRIVLKEYEAKSMKTAINAYSFSFLYSKQSKYLNNSLLAAEMQGMMNDFNAMPAVWDDIYVRIFGDQAVDGVKTFLQPVLTNQVKPASGDNLVLNDLVVQEGGIIDCGEF